MNRRPLVSLFVADAISIVGNMAALVAIPWFVLQETGRPALAGLVGFFTFLPTVIAAFLGGVIVDRVGFRAASVGADVASAVAVAAIPLLHLTVGIELWQLYALVFAGALLDTPGTTARRALLPDVAELAGMRIERASGIRESINRGSLLVGAPLAGVLIATIGATNVLWVDAGSFLVSALLIGTALPAPARAAEGPSPGTYVGDLAAGLRFILGDRLIRAIVLTVFLTNFLDAPLTPVVLPVFVDEGYGSAAYLGVILGTFGAFGLLGSLLFSAIGHRLPRRRTFVVAFFLAGLPYLGLALIPSFPVTLALVAAWGLATAPLNPVLATVGYERIPAHVRGRVLGAVTSAAWAAIPLGALLGGLVVEAVGVQATLAGIGLCYVAITAYGLVNPAFAEMDAPRQ